MAALTRKQYNSVWDHVAQGMGRYDTKKYRYIILPEIIAGQEVSYDLFRMSISEIDTLEARWELVV